ncbi:DnaJ family domain-containing protein [Microlunatus soli]|uniref:DnaJ homologue subfamily C member 28 conserved domain-containing protein n=1 Tax=Microlunatus soli TaxID=630515 RepID=A0A1H1VWI0_9ACTN|nr:DUF1992 domain-containing protein [Microlunatus soli]SDS89227.1 protein of unknown function [Microlunatus soli]
MNDNDAAGRADVGRSAESEPRWRRNESTQDRMIREAQERGEFDNLPGAGKPLRNLGGDWVTQWVQREDLSGVLPPELALRKEADNIIDTVAELRTEAEVRAVVEELNRRIREMRLRPSSGHNRGPDSFLRTVSADRIVGEWRSRRG